MVYFNVFIICFNVFECIYSIFMVYLSVFEYICYIFMVYFNVFIIYLNAFIVCFNVFHYISMYMNVFIDIPIGILPLYCHCNVFTMHIHLRICFSLYTMTSFPTCYTTTLLFFIQSIKKLHINHYFMSVHHPTFHIPFRHWLYEAQRSPN
jgi:hypothetical protein